ncbi:hypothetical protein PN498_27805 [Oscillatoria sp. CS-180]|nr:hypothetical protein [Oscillatoria sp. CS-180]
MNVDVTSSLVIVHGDDHSGGIVVGNQALIEQPEAIVMTPYQRQIFSWRFPQSGYC